MTKSEIEFTAQMKDFNLGFFVDRETMEIPEDLDTTGNLKFEVRTITIPMGVSICSHCDNECNREYSFQHDDDYYTMCSKQCWKKWIDENE